MRGSIVDNKQYFADCDVSRSEWIGEIVTIPDPYSCHEGESLAKVTDAEEIRSEKTINSEAVQNNHAPRKTQTYHPVRITAVDILTGRELYIVQTGDLKAEFAENGAEYAVYAIEEQNENGAWINVTENNNGYGWFHSKHTVRNEMRNLEDTDDKRIIVKKVTHNRHEDADPTDPSAYKLSYEKHEVTISELNSLDVHKAN
jgi:hypothetical protein